MITQASKLTIRGVTTDGSTTDTITEPPVEEVTAPTAVLDPDTEFFVNDSQVKVVDGKVELLADSIVHAENSDQLLQDRTNEVLGTDGENRYYESVYLDLVDVANGNTWVQPCKPVTFYLPYPDGTDDGYIFHLVHFDGLDRDMTVDDLESEIANCNAYSIPVETTEHGIRFTTSTFSPFVLTWQESYSVSYQFQSDTPDRPLPDQVTQLLPVDTQRYPLGTTVKAAALSSTRVEVDGGVWSFVGWDAEIKTIDGDVTLVGTWHFEAGSSGQPEQPGSSNEQKDSSAPSAPAATSADAPAAEQTNAQTTSTVVPQTGDSFPVLFLVGVLILSGFGMAAAWFFHKKRL